ncbi:MULTISPECIES: GPW/gp25 family protein [unclassified Shinella]|uniref:GPW/gp25 family protein n=1 Tax=unclassified Shinella TaxID=2643062 RepID=UPI00234F65D6|nr:MULTISPECIES: GPW/gp25 family protein [unclassified Shinella]MCO5153380.1 GPW/gp25 family protein [Shinella sp.]MDC7260559.1 GPW/gp25 family protein [Shinella sp. HY16]MDC7267454.1 GPW/gp25 family protein [Shinella sp. YZ44]
MADSTGVSAATGAVLTGWPHVEQSISKILRTPIGSRVMRRDFGSDLPDMIDAKMAQRNVLALYSAAATAIARWEPRFRMKGGAVTRAEATGVIALNIYGTYYPRGHHGDYTVSEDATARIVFEG